MSAVGVKVGLDPRPISSPPPHATGIWNLTLIISCVLKFAKTLGGRSMQANQFSSSQNQNGPSLRALVHLRETKSFA